MERIRQMTPEQRAQRFVEFNEGMRLAFEAGLRETYPHATEREIFLRAAYQKLGPELFVRVYGDPLPIDGSV
jgi:hypothetical protein